MNKLNTEELDHVQELVWACVDDVATEPEFQELNGLLEKSPDARKTYVECMQLHADLHTFFNSEVTDGKPRLPSLPFNLNISTGGNQSVS